MTLYGTPEQRQRNPGLFTTMDEDFSTKGKRNSKKSSKSDKITIDSKFKERPYEIEKNYCFCSRRE